MYIEKLNKQNFSNYFYKSEITILVITVGTKNFKNFKIGNVSKRDAYTIQRPPQQFTEWDVLPHKQ